MKYYRVLPNMDGVQVLKMRGHGCKRGLTIDRYLVKNELYTPGEFKALLDGADFRGVRDGVQIFDTVDVPKTKVYWMFGARFAVDHGYSA